MSFWRTLRQASSLAALLIVFLHATPSSAQWYPIPPTAGNDLGWALNSAPATIRLLDNDFSLMGMLVPESITIVDGPVNGDVEIDYETGEAWYYPDEGFEGTDTFTYTVCNSTGRKSNVATVAIAVWMMDMPPVIAEFSAIHVNGNQWRIEGEVSDESPETVTIIFGGLLEGSTCAVQTDGTFSYEFTLADGESGNVWVQAEDEGGLTSNEVGEPIYN